MFDPTRLKYSPANFIASDFVRRVYGKPRPRLSPFLRAATNNASLARAQSSEEFRRGLAGGGERGKAE